MSGRKPEAESRAEEFRRSLAIWRQIPEPIRPSLRAWARELDTSHQLLAHYLGGLDEWECEDRYRRAKADAQEKVERIQARAEAEGREMTIKECFGALLVPGMLDQIEEMRQEAKRGPLHRLQFEMLELHARHGLPGAQELLDRRAQIGVRERKRFTDIVRETPRLEGEKAYGAWLDRILDKCQRLYETKVPSLLSEELLQRLSRQRKPRARLITANSVAEAGRLAAGNKKGFE